VDEGVVIGSGGVTVKAPKTAVSVRKLFVEQTTLDLLGKLRGQQLELGARCELELNDDAFLFSFDPGCTTPLYPDVCSKNFAKFRTDLKTIDLLGPGTVEVFGPTLTRAA